uniref:RRM domain-containing protein n=1 Tax=Arion vulgaris TaxID=1028688 RepID=A0A0B7ABY6_9EUPU
MQAFQKCSHDVENLTLPFQSVQACVGNLPASDTKHLSRSHSPYSKTQGRHSRSITRCCGSASRFSRRSASSLSDCSTCSSCSTSSDCSTCSVLSRSPSSSSSEGGSSRSSSSDSSQSNKYSAKRASHHLTPSKVRQSRSRTVSPEELGWRSKKHTYRNRHSVSLEVKMSEKRKRKEEEQVKAMEERRIVYVGKIPDGYTKKQLYQRFQNFGEIRDVKVNFREHGDNYGFVTYAYACDAIAAKEKGNSVPGEVRFDLCFGGRRHFCSDQYSDLDGNREIEEEYAPMPKSLSHELDYAALLKMHSTHQKK